MLLFSQFPAHTLNWLNGSWWLYIGIVVVVGVAHTKFPEYLRFDHESGTIVIDNLTYQAVSCELDLALWAYFVAKVGLFDHFSSSCTTCSNKPTSLKLLLAMWNQTHLMAFRILNTVVPLLSQYLILTWNEGNFPSTLYWYACRYRIRSNSRTLRIDIKSKGCAWDRAKNRKKRSSVSRPKL